MNVTEFLNVNAEKFLNKPALGFKKKDGWKEINYSLLRKIVFKTANALQNSGISSGDKVAIYADNSAEWICFDLAVISLGAVSVPIFSTSNKDQAKYILEHSEAKIVLVGNQEQYDSCYEIFHSSQFLQKIIVAKKLVWVKKDRSEYFEEFIEKESENFEIGNKENSDLATIIYTSGTTGTPKGVMLSHGNFNKCFEAHFDFFKFKNFKNEHSLAFLPLSHIFERSWTLLCLYAGAKVSFVEDTKKIAEILVEVKPTMMCAVPRFWQKIYAGVLDNVEKSSSFKKKIFHSAMRVGRVRAEFLRSGKNVPTGIALKYKFYNALVFNNIKNKLGGNLWFLPCGGASLSPEIVKFFDAMGISIRVGYGLTESTATLTAYPFVGYEYGTAGIPLGNTEIKIGENDEILAKGDGIMLGYFKNPEETSKVFTEDGFFKTGDAGKIDEKGNLIITDRIKDLMKTSNGKYIAPQQIENELTNNNFISNIMVVAEGRPFVSALIVPNFETLKSQLPELGITFTNWDDIVKNPKIIELYNEKIKHFQKDLSEFEKVKKITLLPADFEIASGEITPTLKVKRKVVLEKYQDLIEKMYS